MEETLKQLFTLAENRDREGLEAFINKYVTPAKQSELTADVELKVTDEKQTRLDEAKAEVARLEQELAIKEGVKL